MSSDPVLPPDDARAKDYQVSNYVAIKVLNPDGSVSASFPTKVMNSLVPEQYDYIECSYTGSDMTGVVYKVGGASGVVVATLVLTYLDSKIETITRV
jgi:hypothetical protein